MCSELENIQKEKKSLFGQNRRRIDDHFANEPDLNVEFNVASKLSPPKARKGKKKRKKVLKIDPKNIQMLLPVEPLPAMDWFEFSTANVETPDELQAPFMPSDLTPEVQQEFNDVYCDQVRQRTVTRFNPTIDDRTLVDLTKRCLRALTNKKEIPVLINVLSQGDTSLGTPEMAAAW